MMKANPRKLTDEQIVKLILDEKESGYFEIIYDRYAKKIFNKCLSFTNDKTHAQDLTQDIILKIYLNLKRFSFKSKFSTWAYSIMYNHCVTAYREIDRHRSDMEKYYRDDTYSYHEDTEDMLFQLQVDRLKELLKQIHTEDQMILLLKYQDDFSIKDIQRITALSESAIKMRLKRAREKIMYLYRKKYGEKTI